MNELKIKERMNKAIDYLENNLRKLRTGRANTSLLENIKVEVYSTNMPLNQLATISVVDYKTILVQPWDANNIDLILKSIISANLGMNPVKDSDILRITVPELTEERRKELIKIVGTYEEEAKISLRQIRKELIEEIKDNNESTEDDIRSNTSNIDKIIKEYNEKVSNLSDNKRKEMMSF